MTEHRIADCRKASYGNISYVIVDIYGVSRDNMATSNTNRRIDGFNFAPQGRACGGRCNEAYAVLYRQ